MTNLAIKNNNSLSKYLYTALMRTTYLIIVQKTEAFFTYHLRAFFYYFYFYFLNLALFSSNSQHCDTDARCFPLHPHLLVNTAFLYQTRSLLLELTLFLEKIFKWKQLTLLKPRYKSRLKLNFSPQESFHHIEGSKYCQKSKFRLFL